jgi:hypothetical protein
VNPLASIVGAVSLIALSGIVWAYERTLSDKRPLSGSEIVDGYKAWTRVNPVPAALPSRIAMMCFTPTAEQVK